MQKHSLYFVPFAFMVILATPTLAQTIPMHSGHLSHGAPQMKAYGSGVHYPNRPKYHHHYGFAGYRSPLAASAAPAEAYEANVKDRRE